MLIGCGCHCGDQPSVSESIPPSESTPSESSVIASIADYEYEVCGCAAVPKIWEVVWPAMVSTAACPIPAGSYTLNRTVNKTVPGGSPSVTFCNWESDEIGPRMKVISSAWACETWTEPVFRVMKLDTLILFVFYSVWTPSGGFGGGYTNYATRYAVGSAFDPKCLWNGPMQTGGSSVTWPDKNDVVFPYTFIAMPAASTITLRPKLL